MTATGKTRSVMTGAQLRMCREKLGLGVVLFGRALGYHGEENSVSVHVRAMEADKRPIMEPVARLAIMMALHGAPSPWLYCGLEGRDKDMRREKPEVWAMVESVGSA